MKFKEAEVAAKNCNFAIPTPLEALPEVMPNPEQETVIICKAPITPVVESTWEISKGKTRKLVRYITDGDICKMSPCPDSSSCEIKSMADKVREFRGYVVINNKKYNQGKVSLDPRDKKLPKEIR